MLERVVFLAEQGFDAGEVVEQTRVAGVQREPLEEQRLHLVVALRLPGRHARERELPRGDLERLAAHTADREHRRTVLGGACAAPLFRVVEEDARPSRRVEALPVDRESGATAHDDIQLLVMTRSRSRLVVLFDDEPTGIGRVGVDAERLDPKRASYGTPLQFGADDRNRLDVRDADDLHALSLRRASSTIGSMREMPSIRSSRLAAPAQFANALSSPSV